MAQPYADFLKAEQVLQLTYGFYLVGYASFTVAFILGILALIKPGDFGIESNSLWGRALGATLVNFEKMNRQWLRFGFLMWTCGLITSYAWGWDPKASWGLVSWLLYGAVLHMHYAPVFKGRKAVWASLFAWGLVLFAYFGINKPPTTSRAMYLATESPKAATAESMNIGK